MNAPPDLPHLPPAMPTCPWCATNANVTALAPPTLRRNDPITEDSPTWPFLCGPCELVFTGTEEEFIRNGPRRHEIREKAKKRNVPEGVR